MPRRILAPLLLLLAAACAVLAVFAVHDIEQGGGPVAQPSNTPFVSPGSDGIRGEAAIGFTTQRPEQVTVRIVDERGRQVRLLVDDERADGPTELTWDGRDDEGALVADGTYHVRITRAGDSRTYEPTRPLVIDTVPPVGRLDGARLVDGVLTGLVLLEDHATLRIEDADGEELPGLRTWRPREGTFSATPRGPRPGRTQAVRFRIPIDVARTPLAELSFDAVDRAGNRTDLRTSRRPGPIEVAS